MPGTNLLKCMAGSLPPAAKLAFAPGEEKVVPQLWWMSWSPSPGKAGWQHCAMEANSFLLWNDRVQLGSSTGSLWRRLTWHSSLHQGTVTSYIYSLTELYVLRTLRLILHRAPWVKEIKRSLWPSNRILVTITQITVANFSSSHISLIYIIFIHLYWELKIEKCLKWESSSPIIYSFKHVLSIFLPL